MSALPLTKVADSTARARGMGADELAELVRAFTGVTERLQSTHSALEAQVGQLKSELAEANEQLRRSRELAALGEMAAGIAHEIRNPLGSIALDVEMLREDFGERGESQAICNRVLRGVDRLDQIVSDVLRFARDLRVHAVDVEPRDIVDAAIESCAALARRAGVTVESSATGGSAALDRQLLTQALVNLVRNAVEAMGDDDSGSPRELRIGARRGLRALADGRRADHVVFFVEDTGPGVPEELLDRIFHPFFTTRHEGTGLGLAIVHRIVDAHGGSITVCKRAPDKRGARFEIALPARCEDRKSSSRQGLQEAVRRRIGTLAE